MHRFYAPAFEAADETIALPDDEAQHLVRVLRVEKGREVLVFNGRGHQCRARVELADKRGVVLRVTGIEPPAPELPFALTLAQAALKGDKTDDIVRDAVMLGVAAVQPLVTRFIDVPAGPLAVGRRVERWQRVAVSSVKQCGRAVVPTVREPATLESALADASGLRLVLVEPALAAIGARDRSMMWPAPKRRRCSSVLKAAGLRRRSRARGRPAPFSSISAPARCARTLSRSWRSPSCSTPGRRCRIADMARRVRVVDADAPHVIDLLQPLGM